MHLGTVANKGKLTDILCPEAQICARAAGGHNAGHSIKANGISYDFHLLPSGLINPRCYNLIGSAVVFHFPSFWKELTALEEKGLKGVRERIFVSDRCQINFDLHAAVDGLEEIELGSNAVGTTKRGIGPAYSTKAARSGVRIHEIFDEETFERKLRLLASGYKKRFGDLLKYDVEEEIERFKQYRVELAPYVVDAVAFMKQAQEQDRSILIEGGQALMLDIDYGTYPYVTSSNAGLGGCVTGLALNPRKISEIIGVVKAYTTRVGSGPFKTEDTGEYGTKLQEIGREWGVSTGRKRRTGHLDLVVVKYSADVNHYTALNLTKLDVLDTFDTIKVAVKYIGPDGQPLESFPADLNLLEQCTVEYKEFEGWQKPTTKAKTWYDLPAKARAYVEFIEEFVGVKVKYIGTGPDREDMVVRK
ncbi:Adenylosuccinate synthetase-like protein [Hapsidospora chrysogenum ATCC 11550]|uniref:Adenylosuccinate synthetase n=1 Tax=Hapsidospora chrysogenum (strain ATCC 11550 / CBS 779.69 / DSM 880 / IAM 14645 / JCM 23072 / IMI 49137) TaxID=857340 RepID=A0A086T9Q3_HAPC1|nr:Adenylosuccinate synthetase-like protein [Hapsidospora chrysogenum ATCC 11550]